MKLTRKAKVEQELIRLEEILEPRMRSITKESPYDSNRNILYPNSTPKARLDKSLIPVMRKLTKKEYDLYWACVEGLNFSSNFVTGFCVEFKHPLFSDICLSRDTFNTAEKKFLELRLLIKIDSFDRWYLVNPEFVYVGYSKQPSIDYLKRVIDWNRNPKLSRKKKNNI